MSETANFPTASSSLTSLLKTAAPSLSCSRSFYSQLKKSLKDRFPTENSSTKNTKYDKAGVIRKLRFQIGFVALHITRECFKEVKRLWQDLGLFPEAPTLPRVPSCNSVYLVVIKLSSFWKQINR